MVIRRLARLGALAAGLVFLAQATPGCGSSGVAGDAATAGSGDGGQDAASGEAASGAAGGAGHDGGSGGSGGTTGAAGTGHDGSVADLGDAKAGAPETTGAAGTAGLTCETACSKADRCCNAVSVTYDDGGDKCAYEAMCKEAGGGTVGICNMYLATLEKLFLPGMPVPEDCK